MFFCFLGTTEVVVILAIALLVFGPAKLPEIGRQIGSAMREMRRMSNEVQRALDIDEYTRYPSNDTYSDTSRTYDYSTETSAWSGESGDPNAAEALSSTEPLPGTVAAGGDYTAYEGSMDADSQAEYVGAYTTDPESEASEDASEATVPDKEMSVAGISDTSGSPDRREES